MSSHSKRSPSLYNKEDDIVCSLWKHWGKAILLTEVSDKILSCIDFLTKDGFIDSNLTLKEKYNKYLHPSVIDLDDEKIWKAIGDASVPDAFQFSTGAGKMTVMAIRPNNIGELTNANSLMRLMGEKDKERPLDRYVRTKGNNKLWRQEALQYGMNKREIDILAKYYDVYYGTPPFQEDIMIILMDKDICGFTLKESNNARKIIGKKQMDKIPEIKAKIMKQATSEALGNYIWDTLVAPQMGYAFSSLHSLAYSFVSIQTVLLATSFPTIYWSTACLAVNSGSANEDEEGKATDYSKIAKALGEIVNKDIPVSLLNINTSDFGFKPVLEENAIRFGLRGVNKVGTDLVNDIIHNRPYESLVDFLNKVKPNKQAMISLIKGGAFDELEGLNRREVMTKFLWLTTDKKKRITLQNMAMLIDFDILPESLDFERRVFNFNRYLKDVCMSSKDNYVLDDKAYNFFVKYFDEAELEILGNCISLRSRDWNTIYQKVMDVVRKWMKANHDNILETLNKSLIAAEWVKYASGTTSAWEMESLCFYHGEHELAKVDVNKYGISQFSELPEEPEVEYVFKKGGKEIPIFKLHKIIGTCVGKDKSKSTISLLTTDGVVDIKFRATHYAAFDKQLSAKQPDGTKKIMEKSWFGRGTKLMIGGFRRGDQFVPKTYAKTPFHTLYKIEEITEDGEISLTSERYQED